MKDKFKFPIELNGANEVKEFIDACDDPRFVVKCLEEHNRWRRGQDEYGYGEDNPVEFRSMPLGPKALGIVVEASVRHLNAYSDIRDYIKKLGE